MPTPVLWPPLLLALTGTSVLDTGVSALGTNLALGAADLRWERLMPLLLAPILLGQALTHGGSLRTLAFTPLSILLILPTTTALAELHWGVAQRTSPLWGGPTHLAIAVLGVQLGLISLWAPWRGPTYRLTLCALSLLGLGLLWNNTQGGAHHSWTWDWIEVAPLALLGGAALTAHAWARNQVTLTLSTYLILLQLSRAALLASAHHLQPPHAQVFCTQLGYLSILGVSTFWPWAYLLVGSGALSSPYQGLSLWRGTPPLPSRGGLRGGLWVFHIGLLLTSSYALAPLWALPSPQAQDLGTSLPYLWCGGVLRAVLKQPILRDQMLVMWRWPLYTFQWQRGATPLLGQLGLLWANARPNRHSLGAFFRYTVQIVVPYFRPTSVFGFALMVAMYVQMYSGLLLSLYYLPDPTFVIPIREDLFMEVWWFPYVYKAHVLGVDIIFTLSYMHILKKFYLKNYAEGDLDGWFTGAYAFLVYHLVVFLGITLSTNHLGDVTIMIAANIYWSLFFRWHKVYAPFFTNKHLSTDQLTRFMIAHYISAWYYTYLVQAHVVFIHEMWDASSNRSTQQTTSTPKGSWLWDAVKKEVMTMFALYKGLAILYLLLLHPDAHVVNYGFFEQWSETEMEEVNFFIVAPHWYFRPHMGLLTVCAHHYEGLAWFVAFYLLLCYTPHVYRLWNRRTRVRAAVAEATPIRQSWIQEILYVGFFGSIIYVGGTLPCGRFYYENIDGFFGNFFLRLSYEYIYLYLGLLAHLVEQLERRYAGGAATYQQVVEGRYIARTLIRG